jgi:hypothetical protein
MNFVAKSPVSSNAAATRANAVELSLFRLYTLRAAYFVMAAGLAVYYWPSVIHHTNEFATSRGIQFALLAGLGATAALGLRYPVQMLPVLLFELTWKAIYLVAFALPLWSAHSINDAAAADVKAVAMVVIFIPLIPWRYVSRSTSSGRVIAGNETFRPGAYTVWTG